MSDITNLNNRINRLRDHRKKNEQERANLSGKLPKSEQSATRSERRFATDFFMLIAYSLLGFALLSQVFLIIWLDII